TQRRLVAPRRHLESQKRPIEREQRCPLPVEGELPTSPARDRRADEGRRSRIDRDGHSVGGVRRDADVGVAVRYPTARARPPPAGNTVLAEIPDAFDEPELQPWILGPGEVARREGARQRRDLAEARRALLRDLAAALRRGLAWTEQEVAHVE